MPWIWETTRVRRIKPRFLPTRQAPEPIAADTAVAPHRDWRARRSTAIYPLDRLRRSATAFGWHYGLQSPRSFRHTDKPQVPREGITGKSGAKPARSRHCERGVSVSKNHSVEVQPGKVRRLADTLASLLARRPTRGKDG